MGETIAKRLENFGKLQGEQSEKPPNEPNVKSLVVSTPGDGHYDNDAMIINKNPKRSDEYETSLYPVNSSREGE